MLHERSQKLGEAKRRATPPKRKADAPEISVFIAEHKIVPHSQVEVKVSVSRLDV